jgi:hypothetical protein
MSAMHTMSVDDMRQALLTQLTAQTISRDNLMGMIHHLRGDSAWWWSVTHDASPAEQLQHHNYSLVLAGEKKYRPKYERWIKVLPQLDYPLLPLDWADETSMRYMSALMAYANERATPISGGAATAKKKKPAVLICREDVVSGGEPYFPVIQAPDGTHVVDVGPIAADNSGLHATLHGLVQRVAAIESRPAQPQQRAPRAAQAQPGRRQIYCFTCKQPGHKSPECPSRGAVQQPYYPPKPQQQQGYYQQQQPQQQPPQQYQHQHQQQPQGPQGQGQGF